MKRVTRTGTTFKDNIEYMTQLVHTWFTTSKCCVWMWLSVYPFGTYLTNKICGNVGSICPSIKQNNRLNLTSTTVDLDTYRFQQNTRSHVFAGHIWYVGRSTCIQQNPPCLIITITLNRSITDFNARFRHRMLVGITTIGITTITITVCTLLHIPQNDVINSGDLGGADVDCNADAVDILVRLAASATVCDDTGLIISLNICERSGLWISPLRNSNRNFKSLSLPLPSSRSLTSPARPAGPHHAAKTTGMKTWISGVNLNHAR